MLVLYRVFSSIIAIVRGKILQCFMITTDIIPVDEFPALDSNLPRA